MEIENPESLDYFITGSRVISNREGYTSHSCGRVNRNIFFNPMLPFSQLEAMREVQKLSDNSRISKSTSEKAKYSSGLNLKANGRNGDLKIEEESKEEPSSGQEWKSSLEIKHEIANNRIVLQDPPLKKDHVRRQERNKNIAVDKSNTLFAGTLKTYRLNKRFGFIRIEELNKDVFFCEDDLVLSGINIKLFKNDVYHKKPVCFQFKIQSYIEKGVEKEKAFEIKIISNK